MPTDVTERSDLDTLPQAPKGPPGLGVLGWLRWLWRQLTSMRTALVLLFLLALASVPGSVLPQNGPEPGEVQQYFTDHPTLAPILDKLSMFDVFAAPWFAAVYLLLFISLAGCVLPRSWRHLKVIRARPPKAPRNLSRLPESASWTTDLSPDDVLDRVRTTLRRRRFRVDTDTGSVAAEKGHLRETGNLVFHIALLGLLLSVGLGGALGYKGNVLVTEGNGFANTVASYDRWEPGRTFSEGTLQPFWFHVDDYNATYITSGDQRGQPSTQVADLTYRATPDSPTRKHKLSVNHPLDVDGAKVYLIGNGYSPTFKVVDGKGQTVMNGPTPFLNTDAKTMTSEGVIKVPDARPDQLAFLGVFLPTTVRTKAGLASAYPGAQNPTVTLLSFKGDLGMDSGTPQSVYQLDTDKLQKIKGRPRVLRPGQSYKLPDGEGTVTFTGYKHWVSIAITYDPGRVFALCAAVLAILGLLGGLLIRRRRIWVRATRGEDGRTVVETGGLTRTDAGGTFAAEFQELTTRLCAKTSGAPDNPKSPSQGKE